MIWLLNATRRLPTGQRWNTIIETFFFPQISILLNCLLSNCDPSTKNDDKKNSTYFSFTGCYTYSIYLTLVDHGWPCSLSAIPWYNGLIFQIAEDQLCTKSYLRWLFDRGFNVQDFEYFKLLVLNMSYCELTKRKSSYSYTSATLPIISLGPHRKLDWKIFNTINRMIIFCEHKSETKFFYVTN